MILSWTPRTTPRIRLLKKFVRLSPSNLPRGLSVLGSSIEDLERLTLGSKAEWQLSTVKVSKPDRLLPAQQLMFPKQLYAYCQRVRTCRGILPFDWTTPLFRALLFLRPASPGSLR
ncbi:hypothetical protein HME9302_00255 [Alteripontixanthobacter maritimus]|uniref:Uncharacterized protein n=1 Tax=Alteripontixanthobacter maritimus TaxID=2161824 RepID=A0A369Q707_9SPHN|nr:hypothetical protein HME9302_00255 [Alteripontixanthobacter maritimus]